MKKGLLFFLIILITAALQAQKDSSAIASYPVPKSGPAELSSPGITIYPVPVRENSFVIKSEKEISFIKITNIIGQDIFRSKYNSPLTYTKIILDNPTRGMYLVTILFSDGSRVVKKIMVEQFE
jgi:hypothetical protein